MSQTNVRIGIDVSRHQQSITWDKVKKSVNFAMLRAGFGQNGLDPYFKLNADGCVANEIPFGVYWFSYAYTVDMARREADYCLQVIRPYRLQYPVAFDWEYDSYNYAYKSGVKVGKELMCAMAKAFLDRIESAGYYAMLYSNVDFLNRGFDTLKDRYDLWLAHWNVKSPSDICGIWQYTSDGRIAGINGAVDMNAAYKDYPAIINKMPPVLIEDEETVDSVCAGYSEKYRILAEEVLAGEWGAGTERRNRLSGAGYDYKFVQALVNAMV